jgi:hypothetical protein
MISSLIRCFVALSAGSTLVAARRYAAHDPVQIVANTVGPFNNPTETYPVSILAQFEQSRFLMYFCFVIQYYHLPYCEKTGKQKRHKMNLGETLSGARKVATPYDVTFLDPVPWRTLCEEDMDVEDVRFLILLAALRCLTISICLRLVTWALQLKEFKDAVEDEYFFEMFVDELPMWGYVGEVSFVSLSYFFRSFDD